MSRSNGSNGAETNSRAKPSRAFRTQSVSPPERIWALTDCCMSSTYEGTASDLVSSTSPRRKVLFSLRSFCPGRALRYDRERCGLLTGCVITSGRPSGISAYMQPRPAFAGLGFSCDVVVSNSGFHRRGQPGQQQGRRIPSLSSVRTHSMCCLLVSGFFTEVTQQIHSLRASGVISSHFARAAESEMRTFRKSAGTRCTAPGEIPFVAMDFILYCLFRNSSFLSSVGDYPLS